MALPLTGLTGHWDASNADDLFTTFVSGGPHTGTPVDGGSVRVWDHEEGAALIFKQSGATGMPVWRQATPLLPLPCLDFTGGQNLILTNHAGTTQPLSALITASAATTLIAFYAETITRPDITYNSGHPLLVDSAGYWGAFVGLVSGVPTVSAYNYDGTQDYVTLPVTAGAPHVLMMRHQGGTLYASLDGGAESSVASGNTGSLANSVVLGINFQIYDGRLGEIAVYNTALTGADLTDALSYFTTKWITGAPTAVARAETFILLPV